MSRPTSSATPANPSPRPNIRRGSSLSWPSLVTMMRREQRHDGDEQSRGRTVQPRLGVTEQHPGQADLDERKRQQPLPLAKRRRQRVTMQRDRQQQQRADQRARAGHHQGVDFADRDANEQVGHAPEQAQRNKQYPTTFRHRGIVETRSWHTSKEFLCTQSFANGAATGTSVQRRGHQEQLSCRRKILAWHRRRPEPTVNASGRRAAGAVVEDGDAMYERFAFTSTERLVGQEANRAGASRCSRSQRWSHFEYIGC